MGPSVLLMTLSPSFLKERGPVRQSSGCCPQGEWAARASAIRPCMCHLFPLQSLPFERWSHRRSGGRGVFLGEECECRSACFSSPLGPRAEAPEAGHRHSTRKSISTTTRTAKRMAMAHHWRRSGRQDTEVTFPGLHTPLPETQVLRL